ncbi:MAG: helix-turn-helix domain-containing protein [Pseudonocardiaceae bacterium]
MTGQSGQCDVMNAREVGTLMGVTVFAVLQWCREGRLPHYRYGPQTVRFRRSEIEDWMADHYVASGDRAR